MFAPWQPAGHFLQLAASLKFQRIVGPFISALLQRRSTENGASCQPDMAIIQLMLVTDAWAIP